MCACISSKHFFIIHALKLTHVSRVFPVCRDIGICSLYNVLTRGQDTNLELLSCSTDIAPLLHYLLNDHIEQFT